MKCDNCGKDNANVRYLRNINGVKKEMNLCEECSEKLGITDIDFNMPIDFSSFLGGFFEDFESSDLLTLMEQNKQTICKGCNSTFEDIINSGKFGCPKCYETFETQIDSLMDKIHGSNRHIGRLGKLEEINIDDKKVSKNNIEESKNENKLEKLKNQLKELVKEEKYEEAAKIRDEIKKLEKEE